MAQNQNISKTGPSMKTVKCVQFHLVSRTLKSCECKIHVPSPARLEPDLCDFKVLVYGRCESRWNGTTWGPIGWFLKPDNQTSGCQNYLNN